MKFWGEEAKKKKPTGKKVGSLKGEVIVA